MEEKEENEEEKKRKKKKKLLNYLVGILSPVNHEGLYQG